MASFSASSVKANAPLPRKCGGVAEGAKPSALTDRLPKAGEASSNRVPPD
jgi:hypothetical protein